MYRVLLRKIKVLFVSLLSGVILLLLVEATLALFFSDSTRYENPFAQPAYRFDAQTIVRLRPDVERVYFRAAHNGGEHITWRANSAGYRGNELREDGTPRIVVYGDSNVHARFSQLDNTYPEQLENKLQAVGSQTVEVVNAGVIGMGPDQNLLRMTRELPTLKPELVILNIFADNDFGDLVRNRLFELSSESGLVRTQFDLEPDQWLQSDRSRRISRIARSLLTVRMFTRLLPTPTAKVESEATELKSELVRQVLAMRESEYAVYTRKSPRTISHFHDSYDIDVALDPSSEVATTKFELMHAVLLRTKELVNANGARFMVLILPSVIDMTDSNAALGKTFLTRYPNYSPEALSKTLAAMCRSSGINALNLYDVFAANDPESLYFRGENDHWNDAGQALAADATVRFLQSNPDTFRGFGHESARESVVTDAKNDAGG